MHKELNLKSIITSSSWVFLGQAATAGTAFGLAWLLANILSPEDFGAYRYVLSFVTLFVIFSLQGLGAAITQTVARGFSGELDKVSAVRMKWSLLSVIAMWAVALYYFFFDNTSLALIFFYSGFVVPFYDVFFTHYFLLQGKQDFKAGALLQAAGRTFVLAFVSLAAWWTKDPLWVTLSFIGGTGLAQYAAHFYTKTFLYKEDASLPLDPELILYGKRLSWLGAFSIIAAQIDKVLVGIFLGLEEVAIYVIALMLPMESHRLGRIFYQVFLPKFSRLTPGEGVKKLLLSIGLLTGVAMIGFGLYFILAPFIFGLFFPKYMNAVPYTQLAMLQVLTVPAIILRGYFVGQKNDEALKMVLVFVPIVRVFLLLIGVVFGGLWGLIIAMLLGSFLEYGVSFIPFFRKKK